MLYYLSVQLLVFTFFMVVLSIILVAIEGTGKTTQRILIFSWSIIGTILISASVGDWISSILLK
jgi:hypothetical protein